MARRARTLLGIDNGSTVIKAGLFDFRGEEIATASGSARVFTPHPGWYERDLADIWAANVEAIRGVLARAGVEGGDVAAVAVAGHGNGLHLVDGAGAPVYRAIEGADTRAADRVRRWREEGTWERLLPRIAQSLWPAQPPALLSWMLEREPEALRRARWAFMVKDFVRFRLTGEAYAELTDISATSLFNVRDVAYDDGILDAYGLGGIGSLLPPLRHSTDLCGHVTAEAARSTGLLEGTPVIGGLFDIDAAAVATGVTDGRLMNVIAGTWCNNQYVSARPVISPDLFMTSVFCVPGHWLILEGSATSASNLEWFLHEVLGGGAGYDACSDAVARVAPAESPVVFLPFLYASNASAGAASAFVGMRGHHTRAHLLRAIYEGVTFSHRTHVEKLLAFRERPEALRIAGGAARSAVWVQMFADALRIPVEVPRGTELGALGAAMCAGVGVGVFGSFDEAARAMVRVDRRVDPDPDAAEIYERKYGRYRRVIEALDPAWDDLA